MLQSTLSSVTGLQLDSSSSEPSHNQKFVTASGLHRGRIIKMAARANERVSSFYKALNDLSNADLLKNQPAEIAKRVFSPQRIKGKVNIVILFLIGLVITVRCHLKDKI